MLGIGYSEFKKLFWIVFLLGCTAAFCHWAVAQDFQDVGLDQYEKQLNAILKTRFKEEKAYVAKVVDEVRKGNIPRKLVDTSFKWVRNRRPDTKYPFVYFARVLQLQGKRIRVEVPVFDFKVYTQRRFLNR